MTRPDGFIQKPSSSLKEPTAALEKALGELGREALVQPLSPVMGSQGRWPTPGA